MNTSELSIVIVSWNTRDMTCSCLQSLYACRDEANTEIIVVDNASSDDTIEAVARAFPQVRVIANESNRYYAEGNNQGVKASSGRYVCILNSDTEVRPGAFERMMAYLEHNDDCAIVGPKLLNTDGTIQDSCNRFFNLLDETLLSTFLGKFPPGSWRLRRSGMEDFDYQTSGDVQQIMGACLMLRRADYLEIGGFDPALSLYFNDHDLSRRFLAQGKKTHYLADAEVLHHQGLSANKFPDLHVYWNSNRLVYLRKYYGLWGRMIGRNLQRLKAVKVFFKILLGPRSIRQKRVAISELKSNMHRILSA